MTSGALRVAMALYGDITFDSRVQREANSLARAGHSVTIFCREGSHAMAPMLDPEVRLELITVGGRPGAPNAPNPFLAHGGLRRHIARLAFLVSYARNLRTWARAVARTAMPFDVWHGHDFTGLVAGSMARTAGSALIYDSHDLFLESGSGSRLPGPIRRLLGWYESRLVRDAALVITVNQGLAAYHRKRHGREPIVVVHNCVPAWTGPEPPPSLIRDALAIPPDEPVILYHGLLDADRGLETSYEAIVEPGLERAHLVLLGFGQGRDRLRHLAAQPRFGGRIHLLDPVSPAELLPWVASADVGVMPNQPRTLNERLSTPNKLFESIAAGLPVVSSDFPERRRIIIDDPLGPLGAVCDPTDPRALAVAIRSLIDLDSAARQDLRRRCAAAAHERWNWETEARKLLDAYRRISMERNAGGHA